MVLIFKEDKTTSPRFTVAHEINTLEQVKTILLDLTQITKKDYKIAFELDPDGDLVGILEEDN